MDGRFRGADGYSEEEGDMLVCVSAAGCALASAATLSLPRAQGKAINERAKKFIEGPNTQAGTRRPLRLKIPVTPGSPNLGTAVSFVGFI